MLCIVYYSCTLAHLAIQTWPKTNFSGIWKSYLCLSFYQTQVINIQHVGQVLKQAGMKKTPNVYCRFLIHSCFCISASSPSHLGLRTALLKGDKNTLLWGIQQKDITNCSKGISYWIHEKKHTGQFQWWLSTAIGAQTVWKISFLGDVNVSRQVSKQL